MAGNLRDVEWADDLLTEKQARLLKACCSLLEDGLSPTLSEIAEEAGYPPGPNPRAPYSNITGNLATLERNGWIERRTINNNMFVFAACNKDGSWVSAKGVVYDQELDAHYFEEDLRPEVERKCIRCKACYKTRHLFHMCPKCRAYAIVKAAESGDEWLYGLSPEPASNRYVSNLHAMRTKQRARFGRDLSQ